MQVPQVPQSWTAALEIGGTHATAALVDLAAGAVSDRNRVRVDSHAGAESILETFAGAARAISAPQGVRWGVAIPDPFDYERGVGRFHDVGKYEALNGVDVRAALATRLGAAPDSFVFINDADAFALGEAHRHNARRFVGITLGTGVGSGWIADGRPAPGGAGVPPSGRIHTVRVDGQPLEERVSSRAIRGAYEEATGRQADVREIVDRARSGDHAATDVLATAMGVLGQVLGPRLREFRAERLVVGGAMSGSWDLLGPWFAATAGSIPPVQVSDDAEAAALLGAALTTRR